MSAIGQRLPGSFKVWGGLATVSILNNVIPFGMIIGAQGIGVDTGLIAIIVGLTRGSGRPEIARATIEAMVFQTRDVVDAMTAASGAPLQSLRVDGGASVMSLLLQMQADQLGVPVQRPTMQETTALGAAYLAGLHVGVWPSLDAIGEHWELDVEVQPAGDRSQLDAAYADWQRAVERSRDWARD